MENIYTLYLFSKCHVAAVEILAHLTSNKEIKAIIKMLFLATVVVLKDCRWINTT